MSIWAEANKTLDAIRAKLTEAPEGDAADWDTVSTKPPTNLGKDDAARATQGGPDFENPETGLPMADESAMMDRYAILWIGVRPGLKVEYKSQCAIVRQVNEVTGRVVITPVGGAADATLDVRASDLLPG